MKSKPFSNESILPRVYENFKNFSWRLSLGLLLLLFFADGCKKVTEQEGLTGVCPIVVSTTPADKAVAVSTNTTIFARFNEAMDASTLNVLTFTLMQGTTAVTGVVTYADSVARFAPAMMLSPNTTYSATITTGVKDPAKNAMVSDYVWTFNTGDGPDVIHPTVISTDPVNDAIGVAPDKKISAVFSEAMNPLTIPTSFSITNTTLGGAAVAGTVTYSGSTAVFTPAANLASNMTYTGTISTNAKDLAGNALAAKYTWNFTTLKDIISPTVVLTDPTDLATSVAVDKVITATFSEAMDPLTMTGLTFMLSDGDVPVAGTVTYSGMVASFTPTADLLTNHTYYATITTGAKDLAGNALVSNYGWSFTTLLPPPPLGIAAFFGAFGGTAGVTNQGLNTVINNGRLGSTAASTLITGFHDGLTADIYTETPLNVGNVTGGIFTAPPAPGTGTSFTMATAALSDATTAYNDISPASKPGGTDPGAGELGGLTLFPGIYQSSGGTFKITNLDLTLDGKGDPNAVWIFQTASSLTVGAAGPLGARSVNLINGAQSKNVFWYVGSQAVINGAGGGVMVGTIIASAGVTFSTAGNAVQTVLNGRALSLLSSVTMVNTTINVP